MLLLRWHCACGWIYHWFCFNSLLVYWFYFHYCVWLVDFIFDLLICISNVVSIVVYILRRITNSCLLYSFGTHAMIFNCFINTNEQPIKREGCKIARPRREGRQEPFASGEGGHQAEGDAQEAIEFLYKMHIYTMCLHKYIGSLSFLLMYFRFLFIETYCMYCRLLFCSIVLSNIWKMLYYFDLLHVFPVCIFLEMQHTHNIYKT